MPPKIGTLPASGVASRCRPTFHSDLIRALSRCGGPASVEQLIVALGMSSGPIGLDRNRKLILRMLKHLRTAGIATGDRRWSLSRGTRVCPRCEGRMVIPSE